MSDRERCLITIAICTYNRADSLRRTLGSLRGLDTLSQEIEVLVVDNNSSDSTRERVGEVEDERLRYILEPRQGLSNARNRVLAEALGELIVFTDDDVEVGRGWLEAYRAALERYPEAEFFAGPVDPRYEGGRPAWLIDENLPLLAGVLNRYDLGNKTRWFAPGDPLPLGANVALRRRLIATLGGYRPELGVCGEDGARGEDTEYIQRAIDRGARGVYVADAKCCHWVAEKRLRLVSLYRYGMQCGRTVKVMQPNGVSASPVGNQVALLIKGVWQLMKGRGDRFRQCIINVGIERGATRPPIS